MWRYVWVSVVVFHSESDNSQQNSECMAPTSSPFIISTTELGIDYQLCEFSNNGLWWWCCHICTSTIAATSDNLQGYRYLPSFACCYNYTNSLSALITIGHQVKFSACDQLRRTIWSGARWQGARGAAIAEPEWKAGRLGLQQATDAAN